MWPVVWAVVAIRSGQWLPAGGAIRACAATKINCISPYYRGPPSCNLISAVWPKRIVLAHSWSDLNLSCYLCTWSVLFLANCYVALSVDLKISGCCKSTCHHHDLKKAALICQLMVIFYVRLWLHLLAKWLKAGGCLCQLMLPATFLSFCQTQPIWYSAHSHLNMCSHSCSLPRGA